MNSGNRTAITSTHVPLNCLFFNPSSNHEQRQTTATHNRSDVSDGIQTSSSSSSPSSSSSSLNKRARPQEHDHRRVIVPGSPDRDGPVLDENLMSSPPGKRSKNKRSSSSMDRHGRCSSSGSSGSSDTRGPAVGDNGGDNRNGNGNAQWEHQRQENNETESVKTEATKDGSKLKVYSESMPPQELRKRFDFCSEIKTGETVAVFVLPAPTRPIVLSNEQQQQQQQTSSLPHLSLTLPALYALSDLSCSIVTHKWLRAYETNDGNDDVLLAQYAPNERMNISINTDFSRDRITIDFKQVMKRRKRLIQSGERLFTGMTFHFPGALQFKGMKQVKCAIGHAGATVRTKKQIANLGQVAVHAITLGNHSKLERFSFDDYNLRSGTEIKLIDASYIVHCLLQQRRLDVSRFVREYPPPPQHDGYQQPQQHQRNEQGEKRSLVTDFRIPKLSKSLHQANRQEPSQQQEQHRQQQQQQQQQQQHVQQLQSYQQPESSDKTQIPRLPKRLQARREQQQSQQQQIQQQSRQLQTEGQQQQQWSQQLSSQQQQLLYPLPQHPQTQQPAPATNWPHVFQDQSSQLSFQQYLPNVINWKMDSDRGPKFISTPFDIHYISLLQKVRDKLELQLSDSIRKIGCRYTGESRYIEIDDDESLECVKSDAVSNAPRDRMMGPLTLDIYVHVKRSSWRR